MSRISEVSTGVGMQAAAVQPELTPTEVKTKEVAAKIVSFEARIANNERQIEDLKLELMELGIRPNGYIHRMGVMVSNEKGELGELETKMFALQKKVHAQDYFIGNLQRQLAAVRG